MSGRGRAWRDALAGISLRDRIVALVVAITLGALLITGASAIALLRGELVGKVDAQIDATVQALIREPDAADEPPLPRGLPTSTFGAFLGEDGTVKLLGRQFTQDSPDLDTITASVVRARKGDAFTTSGKAPDTRWRVIAVPVQDLGGSPGVLVVGQNLAQVRDTVAQMVSILLLVGLGVLAAVGAAGWVIVRRALKPLGEIESVAQRIVGGDFSQRVAERPTSTEVGQLAASLNAMLSQIERSFALQSASEERMRSFISDASHELRTPLAAVRGYAELYRQGAVREPSEIGSVMRRIETEATRMGGLVEDLLTLARLDELRPERRTPVDLTVIAADALQDARALQPDRRVRLIGRGAPLGPTMVLGDEARLRQVTGNIVANALQHTPVDSPIEIAVGPNPQDHFGVLEVRDHGPGVPAEQMEKIFERFFRTDASRQRRSGGAGL
ncbi:MAG: histidine kinase dimerization/phospho-acceptor domain-containing protein, partial [Angustibacter sp.]